MRGPLAPYAVSIGMIEPASYNYPERSVWHLLLELRRRLTAESTYFAVSYWRDKRYDRERCADWSPRLRGAWSVSGL